MIFDSIHSYFSVIATRSSQWSFLYRQISQPVATRWTRGSFVGKWKRTLQMIVKHFCHFSKRTIKLRSMVLWESCAFVISRIQCKKKKKNLKFRVKINFTASFLRVFPSNRRTNFSFLSCMSLSNQYNHRNSFRSFDSLIFSYIILSVSVQCALKERMRYKRSFESIR